MFTETSMHAALDILRGKGYSILVRNHGGLLKRKWMIPGAPRHAIPGMVDMAHRLGKCVIEADYLPDNVAFNVAAGQFDGSVVKGVDLAALLSLKLAGMVSFACAPGVLFVANVAGKTGVLVKGLSESVTIQQDKGWSPKGLAVGVPSVLNDADISDWHDSDAFCDILGSFEEAVA